MSLIESYEDAVRLGEIADNPVQRQMLPHLERVRLALRRANSPWPIHRRQRIQGLYLYGPVGVGKTYLMNLFYQHVEGKKARFHFHHFMQYVDAQLRLLQGQKNPLKRIARDFAKTTRVLCLDEFLVNDIAHAMILAELLQALFERGIVLVTTSNTKPDDLYLNGLQRVRFLPAIERLKTHCEVLSMLIDTDYRQGREKSAERYFYPLNAQNEQAFRALFMQIAKNHHQDNTIDIQKRQVKCVMRSDNAIWFQFDVLCAVPRSQLDYLEIAERFEVIFLSHIPILHENADTNAFLFMLLVDVLYDEGTHLIILAEAPPQRLYPHGKHQKAFQRTMSRLQEMQSTRY